VPPRGGTQGRTEEYLGHWLKNQARDKLIIATKITGPARGFDWIRGGRASRRGRSHRRSRSACNGCRPTTSISTRSTGRTATCRCSVRAPMIPRPNVTHANHRTTRRARGADQGRQDPPYRHQQRDAVGVSEFIKAAELAGLPRVSASERLQPHQPRVRVWTCRNLRA